MPMQYQEISIQVTSETAKAFRAASEDERSLAIRVFGDFLKPRSRRKAIREFDGARKKTPSNAFSLTAREREVLALLAEGHAYGDIAAALSIGTGTVQNHIKALYRKLEVSSKAEAVSVAMRAGLLQA